MKIRKRLVSLALAGAMVGCALLGAGMPGADVSAKEILYGDVNSDGKRNTTDVVLLLRHLAAWDSVTVDGTASDTDGNGKLNTSDAVVLLRYLAGWDIALGPDTIEYTEKKLTAPYEDSTVSLYFGNNLTKADRNTARPTEKYTDLLRLAKNEIEFTQMYLYSENDLTDLTLTISDFVSQSGKALRTEIYSELFFDVTDAKTRKDVSYPDALPPLSEGFKLEAKKHSAYAIKVFTDKDSEAGLYRATVSLKKDGRVIKKAYVFAQVWDFELSDETACQTAFGLSRYSIYVQHRQFESDDEVLYRAYYDYLLENRVTPYYMPYSVLDPKADEYMSNPRVTSFMIDGRDHPHGEMTDGELAQAYEKMKDQPDWMKKGYFYYVDEPNNFDDGAFGTQSVLASADRLKKYFPEYRLTVPYYTNMRNSSGRDMTDVLSDAVNLWCPMSDFWTPYDSTRYGANVRLDSTAVKKYGTAEERFGNYVKRGDELWWYVCIMPQYPYANLFSTYQGTMSRVLLWQQYMYNIKGLLYWSVNYWENGAEWRKMDLGFPYGDGRLVYCGSKYKVRGPIGSIRLEYLRDGIEDFQYLTMIEELCGRAKADEFVARITTGILDTDVTDSELTSVRNEMGELLESILKNK